jgi:hypothetical protein
MPILNVDPDLLAFRAEFAIRLRMLGAQNRGIGINASTASNDVMTNWGTIGWWNNGYVDQGLSQATIQKRIGTASAAMTGVQQAEAIANAMAQLRVTLTQRYRVEF